MDADHAAADVVRCKDHGTAAVIGHPELNVLALFHETPPVSGWRLLEYKPANGTWRIRSSPPSTSVGCLVGGAMAMGELVLIDVLGHAIVYDLGDDAWRLTSPAIAREVITVAIPTTINGVVAVEARGRLRFYDRSSEEWLVGPKTGRADATAMLVTGGDSVYRASRYGLARSRPGTSS